MSTRSLIGKQNQDGTVKAIYCHFDGYLSGVGETLAAHYQDASKVDQLLDLGDASSLAGEIGTAHSFDNRPDGQCTFYGRDRGEKGTEAHIDNSAAIFWNSREQYGAEYLYLMVGGAWFVKEYDGEIMELSQALQLSTESE